MPGRRPSAAHVLTEDTDSFIIGQRVYVDGVKPGRIQFIGETKFGAGEWAGYVIQTIIAGWKSIDDAMVTEFSWTSR